MNKKYTIVNANLNDTEFCIDYFFYIVIFILAIYFVIQFMSTNYKDNFSKSKENFESGSATDSTAQSKAATSTSAQNKAGQFNIGGNNSIPTEFKPQVLTIEQQLQEANSQNNTLKLSRATLEESMRKQARALFLSNNFYRIDDGSFNNEISFINSDFVDIRLPPSDFDGKTLIKTQKEWDDVLAKAGGYKNLYKVGDVVIKPSEYNISKDTICYKDYENNLSSDPNFKKKYPECVVCSINPDEDYRNTKSWKNTKTNIHKVCLFNPNAPAHSTMLNYDGCRKLCSTK